MLRIISTFIGPAIFLGAYVMPMLSVANNLVQYTNVVAGKVEARTSPEAMLESIGSGRAMKAAVARLPFHMDQAQEMMKIGMKELDIALLDSRGVSPIMTAQLKRHRDMLATISGFLRQQKGLSR